MVQEPLASVLRSGRDNFNALFAEARRNYPKLEASAFTDFLHTTLDLLVHACPLPMGETASLAAAGYEIGLQLVGEGLAGTDARGGRMIEEAWRRITPANWPRVASSPHHFFASVSNAVHQLAAGKTPRVDEWIGSMSQLGGQCADLETWLKLGQVLAWRVGMAEWRGTALAVAATLPEKLARAAIGTPGKADWNQVLENLKADLWYDPREANTNANAKRTLRLAGKVGAFRGLGGRFAEPPLVAAEDGQLFVRSGDQCWLLIADFFGHSFHNATIAEFERARTRAQPAVNLSISATKITANTQEIPNPVPGIMTSVAHLPNTLALTSSLSHAVFLIAY